MIQEGEEFLGLANTGPLGVILQETQIHEGLPSQLGAVPTGSIQGATTLSVVGTGSGGIADSDLFTIDSVTGEIRFASSPSVPIAFNFESPADGGADNIYTITLSITDGVALTTQNLTFSVENLPVLTVSQFENNLNNVNATFQSFGSQEAFLDALTDGTLTWNPSLSPGVTFSNGSSAPTTTLQSAQFVYKTLGHTVDLDMAGTFSGVDVGGGVFNSGTFLVDINGREASQFAATPGTFTFSSVGSPTALTVVSGETLSLTATVSANARDMSGSTSSINTNITNTVQEFTAGARIGVGSGAADFAATAGVGIVDAGGATVSGNVGLGVPAISDQQSGITDN